MVMMLISVCVCVCVYTALAATLVTIGAFFLGSYGLNLFPATFVYDNYGPLITVGTIAGFVFAFLAYLKVCVRLCSRMWCAYTCG
jgi:hypothetical protein